MKTRQDAWTEENDLLLAETVLRHVREGSTQLNAFEEVGDTLNRTSAACGFRWNAVVRHQYEKALDLAKKQRKQRQRILGKEQGGKKKLLYQPPTPSMEEAQVLLMDTPIEAELGETASTSYSEEMGHETELFTGNLLPAPEVNQTKRAITLQDVISFLQTMQGSDIHVTMLKSENARLTREITQLEKENHDLKNRVKKLEEDSDTMQEDYETLMKILNRARKLVLFDEEDRQSSSFKMDKNGNLEKLAE